MKKLFVILFLLLSVRVFSQDADSCDYFSIGIFGGSYISGNFYLAERNKYQNTIALDAEYLKTRNLAFYVRGLYEFTEDINYSKYDYTYLNEPATYRFLMTFGARYYLRDKNVRPYFEIGLNQETNYRGPYSVTTTRSNYYNFNTYSSEWVYYYSINFGVGLNVKIYKKLSADIKYDLYKEYQVEHSYFKNYSVLAGIKYNLFF